MAAATTTTKTKQLLLLQHTCHEHPLELQHFTNESITASCCLCYRNISVEAYTCTEGCKTQYYHKLCAEAPPSIDRHPLHPSHQLTLTHDQPAFLCYACGDFFRSGSSSFRCRECYFNMDIVCAVSTLSEEGDRTSEQIVLSLHPYHSLISFPKGTELFWDNDCYICKEIEDRDGYLCRQLSCDFIVHKGCIQDQYYADGTKAPRVYHRHPLETFVVGEDMGSRTCSRCGSDKSGEFIGCETCRVFYHRNCFQVPEIIQYPTHHPNHTLVLFPDTDTQRQCQSCSISLKDEIYYRCTSCEFFVHVGCALEVLAYCEEGISAKIELSWHKHPLLLCHQFKSSAKYCSYCEDQSIGPTYVCKEKDCRFRLHKRCTEIESTIIHPQHPEHLLTLHEEVDGLVRHCKACFGVISMLSFSCEICAFYLHIKCATRVPTRKHYLHEHELLRLAKVPCLECSHCGTSTDSPFFRCVPCNFNLHEKCMELPRVVKHDTHVHPLTLRDFYMEDDSGEYYCDLCGGRRDGRLGVYVCEECKVTWAFQIECVLPELGRVYAEKSKPSVVKRMDELIARKNEELHAIEEKLEEAKRELIELVKRRDELVIEEEKYFVTVATDESGQESSV